jgi:pimeloyl-ACP methyl ester carboxylesterase
MFNKGFRIALRFAATAIILAACGAPAASPIPAKGPAPAAAVAATPNPPAATAIPAIATPVAGPQAAATNMPELSGDFQANGRSLYIKCLGTGSPTIVLEAGNAGTVTTLKELHAKLAQLTTTCADSRANLGRRGSAPIPHAAKDVVDDLQALLAAAKVPGPYVLVGHDTGGLFVQLYARTYPDQVAGVVALDPQLPAHPWLDDISKIVTERELADEKKSLIMGTRSPLTGRSAARRWPPHPNRRTCPLRW